jgi:hypothetical protein
MKSLARYPEVTAAECGSIDRSLLQNLREQKQALTERLAKVNAALEALEKQPEVADLLEKVMKII